MVSVIDVTLFLSITTSMMKQLELTRLLIKLNSDIKRVTSSRSSNVFVLCVKRGVCIVCTEYTLWRIREVCIIFSTKYIVCKECTIFTLCTRRSWQVLSSAYFPMSYDQNESVLRKICLSVSNCKSCFFFDAERWHASRRVRFHQHREAGFQISFLSAMQKRRKLTPFWQIY